MRSVTIQDFEVYTGKYNPFPWDTHEDDYRKDIHNKHSLLINYIRYFKVIKYIQIVQEKIKIKRITDVGPYPGVFVHLIKDLIDPEINLQGIGLSFSEDFTQEMEKLKVLLFETDIDPEFSHAKECLNWPNKDNELVLLLDVIEHLVSPVYCLDQINRVLKPGGYLIITTDNISSFGYAYEMIRRGKSPNVHPLKTSMFYKGDWRPHHREFSKEELEFYLNHCGFQVVQHEFFERKQGDYYKTEQGTIYEKQRYSGIKKLIFSLLIKKMPHLRDHQIILAKKVKSSSDLIDTRPKTTSSMETWMKMRQELNID